MADRLRRADRALRALAQGTASATGDEFFRSLARCAAQALGARYAVVAEGLSDTESRSLAFWEGSGFGPGFSFFLQGTPCSSVAAGRVCATASGLVAEYPEALWLQQIGAESYVGVPMRNGLGRAIGHLAVLHTEPMETTEEDIATLKIFAARGSAELERKQSDERLQKAHAELGRAHAQTQALLEIMWAVGHHLQREVLFGALAECLGAVVPTETFGIVLPTDGDQLQAYILNRRDVKSLVAPPLVVGAEGSASDWVLTERDWYVAGSREEVARRFPKTSCLMKQERMESLCILPLVTGDRVRGALFFMTSAQAAYATLERSFLGQVAGAVAVALDDCLLQEEMRRLNDELAAQKIARIEAQNSYLQEEIRSEHNFVEIIGNSPALLQVLRQIDQVAPTDSTVLICGETGTGKELVARALHDRSPRRDQPLVKVSCGAISTGLVESELFGHVKGAFTGAIANREGRFALADGGAIFLDEVGELPMETQVKLLRVLQEQEFEPIGSAKTRKVNVRVIAATNRDLDAMVREGKFRSDLFYRLNVVPVTMPSLRHRVSDIPLLTVFFLDRFARKLGRPIPQVSEETMMRLCAYAWPGNIRELQNVIERATVLSSGPLLLVEEGALPGIPIPSRGRSLEAGMIDAASTPPLITNPPGRSLEEIERQHIIVVLQQTKWRIDGAQGAARILDLHPSTLRSRMRKLGIARPGA